MRKKKKVPTIRLQPDSSLAKGLVMMLEHKKLRERFWRGEISITELNQLLKEKGINKQYEHSFAL
jgi:SPX domain protein involved in polyphosphate accumulation